MYMTSMTQTEWVFQINMARNLATQKKLLIKYNDMFFLTEILDYWLCIMTESQIF